MLRRLRDMFRGSSQRQRVERGATAVQIIGHRNTVLLAGAATLYSERRHARRTQPKNLRDLLLTELRATDLTGRREELSALRTWMTTPRQGRDISVHCLTGQGGAGKTRLAIELCEWAEQEGWSAGFVRQDELERFHTQHHPSEWQWPRPTLVVADYAATSLNVLRNWLEALARGEAADHEHKLRILLLERHADRETGWWAELTRPGGYSGPGADSLIDGAAPLTLGPLRAVEHRRALLDQAMRLAAPFVGKSPPALPLPGAEPSFDRALADPALESEPLFLLMAGVVAVDTGAPAAMAMGRLDLAAQVVDNEYRRLEHVAAGAGVDKTLLWHLAACVTLQSGCDIDTAAALVEGECAALGERSAPRTDRLVALLRDALPRPEADGVDAVRPDLIGEAFLLRELVPKSLARQTPIVERAFHRAGSPVVATVIRTAQDYALGDPAHASVTWLQHLAELTDDPFALIAIAEELPEETLALRERAADITRRIVDRLAALTAAADADLQPHLATALNNLAVRLGDLGEREAALAAAREAAELYRALAAQRPDAFRPGLAMALNTLANRLSELGEREAAQAAAREAADLYRALAAQRPDAFRPNLATSLNTLAGCLDAVGRRDAGLAANAEAITELMGPFRQHKRVFAERIAGMAREYLQRCEALATEPDQRLLAPVAEGLAELQAARSPDADPETGP